MKKYPGGSEPYPSEEETQSKWIDLKSRGKLSIPSQGLVKRLQIWGLWFNEFHGESINRDQNPVDRFAKIISSREELVFEQDIYAANLYSKIRFFHRIKLLNAEIRVKERSEKARKLKQLGQFIA